MRIKKRHALIGSSKPLCAIVGFVAVMLLLTTGNSQAFDLPLGDGDWSGQLNMKLGYGLSARLEDSKVDALSPNSLGENYWDDSGDVFSNVARVNAELGLNYKNFGLVSNASYAYDFEIMDADRDFHQFNQYLSGPSKSFADDTEDVSGSTFELLDAYVFGTFEPAEMDLEVRVGKQVINWGEGLYFLDGVATQVPFNLARLTMPGSDLKEAYIGLDGVRVMLAPTDDLSLDAYYLSSWDQHQFPGTGTFYGDDLVGPGTKESWKGSAGLLDPALDGLSLKGSDRNADDDGQFGVSARYVHGDIEYGLYYSRHHEFFPTLGSNTSVQVVEEFHEDVDMYGASISTSLGMWSLNAEVAYRPDRKLFTNVNELYGSLGTDYSMGEKHDTVHSSAHALGYYGGGILGVDSNFYAIQLGWEYIDGSTDNLQAHNTITRSDKQKAGGFETADEHAFGIAAGWDATWFNVLTGVDLTSSLFIQYDFSGNSHFWGNFAEDRVLSSLGLTASIGNSWEAGVTYARWDQTDSHYEDQDSINFSVDYTF